MSDEISSRPDENPAIAEKFAKQAHDLDALRKAVEDAASVGEGIWLSYLFVLFYIGIAAGAVTHKDLLLANAVKLPSLGVELPLVAFFFLAPIRRRTAFRRAPGSQPRRRGRSAAGSAAW
jgi:hypothetical protein